MTYGTGTRSYNRSPEARQMKEEQQQATAKYQAGEKKPYLVPMACPCCQHSPCVWGKGPVWPTSPQFVKEYYLDPMSLARAEQWTREMQQRSRQMPRKPKINFLDIHNSNSSLHT